MGVIVTCSEITHFFEKKAHEATISTPLIDAPAPRYPSFYRNRKRENRHFIGLRDTFFVILSEFIPNIVYLCGG